MLLKDYKTNTEFGIIHTLVAHCDYCGRKHLVGSDVKGGAMSWLEVRRFDREVPPIHFCSLEHLVLGIQALRDDGIIEINSSNWEAILDHCSTAEEN